jgi:hypothetical protein
MIRSLRDEKVALGIARSRVGYRTAIGKRGRQEWQQDKRRFSCRRRAISKKIVPRPNERVLGGLLTVKRRGLGGRFSYRD